MRVLLGVPWDGSAGGVSAVVGRLAAYLESSGHRAVFLLPGDERRTARTTTSWGFDGYRVPLRSPGHTLRARSAYWTTLPAVLSRLRTIIQRERIDVVNLHYPTDLFAPLARCRRRLDIRLVISIHGADLFPDGRAPRYRHPGVRALLRAADSVVAPSRAFLDASAAQQPDIAAKGTAIHNGVDVSEFASLPETWRESPGPPTVLCIAALTRKKAQDVLLSAFPLVLREHPDARLVLVGEGPERPALEALSARLDLAQRVQFAGLESREQVVRRLQDARVVVLPSREEPFGLASVEGMMATRPVVASAVGGLPEIVTDGVDGLLVPPEDPAALAAAIARLLGDADLRARLGTAGRQTVHERFRYEHTGAAYLAHFEALLAAR